MPNLDGRKWDALDGGGESGPEDAPEAEEQFSPEERIAHLLQLITRDEPYTTLGKLHVAHAQAQAIWDHNDHQDFASAEYKALCSGMRRIEGLTAEAMKLGRPFR